MGDAHDALELSWADEAKSPAEQFRLFRAFDAREKVKLVAYATANTTQSCFAQDPRSDSLMHAFEIEVMPDIRAHWTPNAALFNRFKKARLLKILGEELGLAQEAVTLAASSKKEIRVVEPSMPFERRWTPVPTISISGFAHRSVPVGQEGRAAACMRDLRRDARGGEAEKCHGFSL